MPTYDYECKGCGNVFEYFQNMSDEPLSECPKCGNSVKRLIGGGMGIIFKGNGFYVTDNKKSGSANATGSTSKSSDTPKTSSTGSKDKSSA